jgi:PleD family two-component response regulator
MSVVLIVDENEPVRRAVADRLADMGLRPVAVDNERAAALLTERLRPDLVLLDCSAPYDCLPLLDHLRAHSGPAAVPVIAYADRDDERLRDRALAVGAAEFVVKGGVAWASLPDRVEEHLIRAAVARDRARRDARQIVPCQPRPSPR